MVSSIGIGRSGCPSPLPPNRTGGFPASGFPVGGSPRRGLTDPNPSDTERPHGPNPNRACGPAPPQGVVNMASQVIVGARPVALATKVPVGLARRHLDRCRLRRFPLSSSTFLRSLRSRPVTALLRSYGRSDSCSPALFSALPRRRGWLLDGQVSLIHALGLPTILSPNTCGCCASPRHVTCRRVVPRKLPHGKTPNGNSGLRPYYAGSPHLTGRIEFRFPPHSGEVLRTGRSPPMAPHPVSRRRSDLQLQVYVKPGEDFHLSNQVRSQAHVAASLPRHMAA